MSKAKEKKTKAGTPAEDEAADTGAKPAKKAGAKATAPADQEDQTDQPEETGQEEPADADAAVADAADGGSTGGPLGWSAGDDSLRDMMSQNFIEYASYVIKDRAIPDINDGLKPVQRRILHTLWEHDDGRFHKVANIVGATMRYHPHGDASIYDALVVLANKEYFVDRQGNFGNIHTGDPASAARYIECRLSPLAREVMFNPEITEYVDSYDGRNREPVTLPAKVPALLMLGAGGIAVGMSTTIFPHNFNELLKAQISILRDEPFHVYPDFLTGGTMDVGDYADGAGRVRVRAKIEAVNDKTLVIREIPAGTTTESLIASIEKAVRNGKLKISSINDYTAEKVEIEVTLPRGVYAEETVKLLYAYTDCEMSLSSNLMIIKENRPVVMTVSDILRHNTAKLMDDLRREQEIELGKLLARLHAKTLAQVFFENRVYKRIEECETDEAVHAEVRAGMEKAFAKEHAALLKSVKDADLSALRRDISAEDIEELLKHQIRRISLFDIHKNRQEVGEIIAAIAQAQDNLLHLKSFTIKYIKALLAKHGHLFPRRTQITDLAEVNVREVALKNLKVGHDRAGQFVGYNVKNSAKDQEPLACSEFDRLVLLRSDGGYKVVPVPEKIYVGPVKFVLLADRDQVYSMIYRDKKSGAYYAKRFRIDSYIMDKDYEALPENCVIELFSANYGVQVRCEFVPKPRMKNTFADVNFEEIEIRSAGARGFKITDNEVKSFTQTRRGSATPQGGGDDAPPEGGNPAPEENATDTGKTDATAPVTPPEPPPPAPGKPAKQEAPESAPADAATGKKRGHKTSAPTAEKPASKPVPAMKPAQKPALPAKKAAEPVPAVESADDEGASDEHFSVQKALARRSRKEKEPEAAVTEKPAAKPAGGAKPAKAAKTEPESKPSAENRKSLRKLIDEDSPFFLQ